MASYVEYEKELVSTSLGRKYWIYKDDSFYQQRIAGAGPYQGGNLRKLRDLCPNARTVIDVGMNIAMNTIEYATWAKEVHSFEPTPQTYEIGLLNIELAKQAKNEDFIKGWYKLGTEKDSPWANLEITGNITTYPVGLGPEEVDTEIIIRPNNAGHNHIENKARPKWNGRKKEWVDRTEKDNRVQYEKVPVKVKTLDSYEFKDVDIIKIDVEGFEYDVMLGAVNTIEKYKPVVQVEMVDSQPKRFGYTLQDIIDFFDQRGYGMMLNDGTVMPMVWEPVKRKMDRFFVHKDHAGWPK